MISGALGLLQALMANTEMIAVLEAPTPKAGVFCGAQRLPENTEGFVFFGLGEVSTLAEGIQVYRNAVDMERRSDPNTCLGIERRLFRGAPRLAKGELEFVGVSPLD